jgi:hypothetical protein
MMVVSRLRNHAGLLILVTGLLLLISQLPLRTAFELGDDEGFEVIKPFLCSKGYKMYTEIWNDQPPIFTVILTAAFRICGDSIMTARFVSVAFGLLLIATFYELVRRRSGTWAAVFATFFLVASPSVLLLSVSVMLETPAVGTALFSALLTFQLGKRRHWFWLLASGAAMAVALQINLTAVLVTPAVLVELLLLSAADFGKSRSRTALVHTLVWGVSLIAVFVLIGLTLGKGSLETSWKSHTGAAFDPEYGRPEDHKFDPRLLRTHIECVVAAGVAIVVAFSQKRLREIAFPLVLLLTVSAVHTVHRPWWNYYYLHLAVPLAWLTGWLVNDIFQRILKSYPKGQFNLSSARTWKVLALCALVAAPIARSERRLEGTIKNLRQRQNVSVNPIVRKMKQYADRTKWVYSESGIYPFHAGMVVPPELAIVMPKRFWSGQITTQQIVETCKRYQTEMLVLPVYTARPEWKVLLDAEYSPVATDGKHTLYIAKRVKDQPP